MILNFLRLLLTGFISLLGLTLLTFFISQQAQTPLHLYQSKHSFGQYFEYLQKLIAGDWGRSSLTNGDVLEQFLRHFPATFELIVFALVIAISLGLLLGILAAKKRGSWLDNSVMAATLIGYSMPIFWWGLLLVLFFSLFLGLTPVAGRIDYQYHIPAVTRFMLVDTLLAEKFYGFDAFKSALQHLILPALTLSTIPMAIMARMTRSSLVNILNSEYIRTARSKGLSETRIIWVHAIRNALQSLLTIGGLQISIIMTGVILTEYIFAWPGIGNWLLNAVSRQDYASIQGGILALSSMVIIFNLLLELLANYFNPRKRRPV